MAVKKAPKPARTIREEEIGRFSALAESWWNPRGPMAPLHRLNPVRLDYIREKIAAHFKGRGSAKLSLLDIGCGAGLVAENLAANPPQTFRLNVTGVDASEKLVEAARAHARQSGVAVDYRAGDVDALASAKEKFDVVLALEVIEHVDAQEHFVQRAASLLAPQGLLILSTLNRSAKGFLLGIVGAEYVMRWLPRGTHDWRHFVKPSELAGWVEGSGLAVREIAGLCYSPLTQRFSIRRDDVDVNYLLCAG